MGTNGSGEPGADASPQPDVGDMYDELDALEESLDDSEERARVGPAVFGRVVRGFGSEDLAEASLGAVIFGVPMFVEGGTREVGALVASHPMALGVTLGDVLPGT
jgi:hypothetical protein